MERQQIYLSFLNQILKLLKILKCIILICTLYDANGKEISSEQIKDIFPVQITLNASLPYTLGKDYSVYFCDGNAAKKQNVIYSDKSKVTFQASKYGRFTLYAKWNEGKTDDGTEATPAPTGELTTEPQPTAKPMPFTDVNAGDWFYNNVQYVYENGLMSGVSDTEFAPNENVTRGMFVTILYRMDGEPNMGASTFTDVPSDAYYANAVAWANANGIVEGYSDTEYAPDDAVTREQAAAILFRYAAYKGEGPTGAWAIRLDYPDLAEISDWAAEGVMFCTMKDIMVGRVSGEFDPKVNITRAEGAAVFERYLNMTR